MLVPRKSSLYISMDARPPRFNLFKWFRCKHEEKMEISWTDYRSGPGWMSDSYEACVCKNCGAALSKRRTY
jgi:hypothetical protein